MDDRLVDAIRLREAGSLDEARTAFLALVAERPGDARVNYHTAWAHDRLGLEREAVPFYERALALGLGGDERAGALLGLGSTYRAIGDYANAVRVLREGVAGFPERGALAVFLAMALYNAGAHREAVERLLRVVAETSDDESVRRYRRAIEGYAADLDRTW